MATCKLPTKIQGSDEYCHRGLRANSPQKYEVGMNIVTGGYVRKNSSPKCEVGMNIVTIRYVRSTSNFSLFE